jgi:hypothetical protein
VKKLRKNEKSLKATEVPEDFEPEVIDETDEGGCTVIVPARPPQGTEKPDQPKDSKRSC